MKLKTVKIKNFRSYKDEITIDISDLTVFIGKNDVGKSTILEALSIFFEESKMEVDDVCVNNKQDDVIISCEFYDADMPIIIDANVETTLKDEYLLNERNCLEIIKVYSCTTKVTSQVLARAHHPTNEKANDLLTLTNPKLKKRAQDLGVSDSVKNLSINSEIRKAIWNSFELKFESQEIILDKASEGQIWPKLKSMLPTFALFKSDRTSTDQDSEAQDPMKSAIAEAIKDQELQLNEISKLVEDKVMELVKLTIEKLQEMDFNFAQELKPRFIPPKWDKVFGVSLTDENQVPMNKRGSGVRRLILLNFFRAKAESTAGTRSNSNVIYAIEEPETSQHPHNQRILIKAFEQIVEYGNSQIMLTTHNPQFSRLTDINNLRYVSIDGGVKTIKSGSEDVYIGIINELGIHPDHKVKLFLQVEGKNDESFLKNISKVLRREDKDMPDIESLEIEGKIIIMPLGGQNLSQWINKLNGLHVPTILITDRDTPPTEEPKYKKDTDRIHPDSGMVSFTTKKREMENYIHIAAIQQIYPDFFIAIDDQTDVPLLLAKYIHETSESHKKWDELNLKDINSKISKAKRFLNNIIAPLMTAELLSMVDTHNEIKEWFFEIKKHIK